jgi:hypothetical protein
MSKSVAVEGRNFFCNLTNRAVRVRWQVSTLIQDGVAIAASGPSRISCLMKRFDCPRTCKYLGGLVDPETAARRDP